MRRGRAPWPHRMSAIRRLTPAAAFLAVLVGSPLAAQEPEWTEISLRRQAHGVRELNVDVEYAAGELRVFPAREGLLYEARIRYDARLFEPKRTWSLDGGIGRLTLGLKGDEVRWRDVKSREEDRAGLLSLGLGREIETKLAIEVGAAKSRLRLGGIPLTELKLETGASRTTVSFDEPNPVALRRFEISAGAAEVEILGLGNARVEQLEVNGALGEVHLDFTGDWRKDATAGISVGLGALTLTLPRSLGVEVKKDGFFASFDHKGFVKVGDAYRTPQWEAAAHRLEIDLRAVVGAVDIEFVD